MQRHLLSATRVASLVRMRSSGGQRLFKQRILMAPALDQTHCIPCPTAQPAPARPPAHSARSHCVSDRRKPRCRSSIPGVWVPLECGMSRLCPPWFGGQRENGELDVTRMSGSEFLNQKAIARFAQGGGASCCCWWCLRQEAVLMRSTGVELPSQPSLCTHDAGRCTTVAYINLFTLLDYRPPQLSPNELLDTCILHNTVCLPTSDHGLFVITPLHNECFPFPNPTSLVGAIQRFAKA
jgi:hypothetical protein